MRKNKVKKSRVVRDGEVIAVIEARLADAESWARLLSEESGQRVAVAPTTFRGEYDVHFLGDADQVRAAINECEPDLEGSLIQVFSFETESSDVAAPTVARTRLRDVEVDDSEGHDDGLTVRMDTDNLPNRLVEAAW